MKNDKNENYKIVIIGESAVGKSSIFIRYTKNDFQDHKTRTINATCGTKFVKDEGINYILNIWDTAGEEKYHALAPIFYRDAEGAILVFDLTSKSSFEFIDKWFQELKSFNQGIKTVLCGNKSDLKDYMVSTEEAENLAEKYDSKYIETSAKRNINIDKLFSTVANDIYTSRLTEVVPKKSRKSIRLSSTNISKRESEIKLTKKKRSCC